MAKRFGNLQLKEQASKKPKLQISFHHPGDPFETSVHFRRPTTVAPSESEDLWGADDDDDVVLLASQAVDEGGIDEIRNADSNLFSDISFGKFSKEVDSSTQLPEQKENPIQDFFIDGDDAEFDNIMFPEEAVNNQKRQNPAVPTTSKCTEHFFKKSQPNPNGLVPIPLANSNVKQNSKDVQVNYLVTRLENFRKENENLCKEVTECNEKVQTKDGEVSMLRHEIKHLKQQCDGMRMEKIQQNENVKKEWHDKIHELEKLIKSQQSELEFKNLEISNFKLKKLNDSQRFYSDLPHVEVKRNLTTYEFINWLHLPLNYLEGFAPFLIPNAIFEEAKEITYENKIRDTFFYPELSYLKSLLAELSPMSGGIDQLLIEHQHRIFNTLTKLVNDLKTYTENLEFTKYRDTSSTVEYRFLCQNSAQESNVCDVKVHTIYQEGAIFGGEKAIALRRTIAVLSLLCVQSKTLGEIIVNFTVENEPLLMHLKCAVDAIGFSLELYDHFGVIEACGNLLNSLTNYVGVCEEFLLKLAESLIYSRVELRGLIEISKFLHRISTGQLTYGLVDKLCTKGSGAFNWNENYKMFQFSGDCCPLKIYGYLLENAAPKCSELSDQKMEQLFWLCLNHVKFLRNSFLHSLNWVAKPNANDGKTPSCCCYARNARNFVILFYLLLNRWIMFPKFDRPKISKIAKLGTLLLCDIFYTHFRREVLQNCGGIIKNQVQILYDWLNEYKDLLHFKSAHLHALQYLKESHIMADPLKSVEQNTSEKTLLDGNAIWQNNENSL